MESEVMKVEWGYQLSYARSSVMGFEEVREVS